MAKAKKLENNLHETLRAFSIDPEVVEQGVRGAAVLQEKLANVAIAAADRSNELALDTARDTVNEYAKIGHVKGEAAEYATAFGEFAKFAAERVAQNATKLSEIVNAVQKDAAELLVSAGENAAKDAATAAKNAANDVTKAVKKAAA